MSLKPLIVVRGPRLFDPTDESCKKTVGHYPSEFLLFLASSIIFKVRLTSGDLFSAPGSLDSPSASIEPYARKRPWMLYFANHNITI